MQETLLEIDGLTTNIRLPGGPVPAVDTLDLQLAHGEILGIVGESGSGKTLLALSVMGLVPQPPASIDAGRIVFDGVDLRTLSEKQMSSLRGRRISMVFQEPMTALNPVLPVSEQLAEVYRRHMRMTRTQATAAAADMLHQVGIPLPEQCLQSYPHELSGGMRQRVVIAMALACGPDLVLADEPTTALDVTIQAQILRLMRRLCREKKASVLLITHDLGVVAQTCERVVVMYAGKVVESARVDALFGNPLHPYTQGLLRSIPVLPRSGQPEVRRIEPIPGTVPSLQNRPQGCAFHPRCPRAFARCHQEIPYLNRQENGSSVRCWLYN